MQFSSGTESETTLFEGFEKSFQQKKWRNDMNFISGFKKIDRREIPGGVGAKGHPLNGSVQAQPYLDSEPKSQKAPKRQN